MENDSQLIITEDDSFEQMESALDILLYLRKYARHVIPCFCIVGILGNCMALILIRTNYWLKRLTSNIYLCTLSVCSCIFLVTVLFTWIDGIFEVPVYNSSEFGCRLLTFFAHMSDFNCVWMISWISCDRAVVLFRPGIRKNICSKSFARYMVIGTVFCSCIFYSWCLLSAGLEEEQGVSFCGISMNLTILGYDFTGMHINFTFLDTVICTILPSVLISLVNSLAVYRYRQCMKIYSSGVLRVRFNKNPNESGPQIADHNELQEYTTNVKRLLLSQQQSQTTVSTQSRRSVNGGKLRSSDLQLSRSLLIVTSTFVCLTVPNYIFRLYISIFNPTSMIFQLLYFATFLLYYLHHAVLFYMYIFWSPQMKKQLKPTAMKLLECYCCKTVPDFGHSQHMARC